MTETLTTEFEEISMEKQDEQVERVSSKHEVCVKSCPVNNATVFIDRAEVNRLVEVDVYTGDVEVLIKDLPSVIDEDSVRVTCYGEIATIVEVAYQTKAVSERKESAEDLEQKCETEKSQVLASIKKLEKEKLIIKEKVKLVENERNILEQFSKCVSSNKEDKVSDVLEKKSVENVLSFLTIYRDRSQTLCDTLFKLNEEIDLIDKELVVLEENFKKLGPGEEEFTIERNISILLDVFSKGSIKLVVSYVVSNASWTPLYDVRAFNKDTSVQILYFATIKQNTGEDWQDAKLSLSTAMPSIGGTPPELTPQVLDIQRAKPVARGMSFVFSRRSKALKHASLKSAAPMFAFDPTIEDLCYIDQHYCESGMPSAMAVEGITSTTFEIARVSTIQSDDVGHKVSICQLDFSPQFEYIATPKVVAHAFLKIKTRNESSYALLAGVANVFLDNNFLTKSYLQAVSPMEEFEVSLGVDPAVKVTYKPLKKFEQRSGIISKAEVFNFHQQIEVKNTKIVPIKILISDQCPRVANEKIKVVLQEPDIKIPKVGTSSEPAKIECVKSNACLYTSDHKVEWTLNIPASETKKIDLKYSVEHPVGMRVTGL